MNKPYSALDVASYLIRRANEARPDEMQCTDLTPLKLQKILYFAQGWYLAGEGEPLFSDPIYAWRYGPVVRSVYNYYRGGDVAHITPANTPGNAEALLEDDKKYLDAVWKTYGGKTAFELVGMTHVTDPWDAANNDPVNDEIDTESMKKYFSSLL